MPNLPARLLPIMAVVALGPIVLAACGEHDAGEGGGSADADSTATESNAADAGGEAAGSGSDSSDDCDATDLTFANTASGVSGTATSALAKSALGGGTYQAYVADFDITEDDLRQWRPEVPEGHNVFSVQLTVFNSTDAPEPVPVGAELEVSIDPDELVFLVGQYTTDDEWTEATNIGVDTVGQLTVTNVGDTFCFEIDYQDQDKEISGTVRAPVFEQS